MTSKDKGGSHKTAVDGLAGVLEALEGLSESDQLWIVDAACSRLGISGAVSRPPPAPSRGGAASQGSTSEESQAGSEVGSDETPKEFLKDKKPKTDVQRVACLAYYLHHHRDQQDFKTADLTKLNTEAAGIKMGNPSQAVNNATKQSHYLTAAGGGRKQISALGEDVVEALPDQAAVKAAESEHHKPKRKVRSKKATKRSGK